MPAAGWNVHLAKRRLYRVGLVYPEKSVQPCQADQAGRRVMSTLAHLQHFSFLVGVTGLDTESSDYEDALFEAGCDDALISVVDGRLRLDFEREAESYDSAIETARRDIQKAGGSVAYIERQT
jgi:predicted TIM-barrel enzyme